METGGWAERAVAECGGQTVIHFDLPEDLSLANDAGLAVWTEPAADELLHSLLVAHFAAIAGQDGTQTRAKSSSGG